MAGEYNIGTAGNAGALTALYKEVYADDMANLIKANKRYVAYNNVPFDQTHRPGGTWHQPALLNFDGYLEFRGPKAGAVTYGSPAPAIIGDAQLTPSNLFGRSLIDTETASRGVQGRYVFRSTIGIVAETLFETGVDATERQLWSGGINSGVIVAVKDNVGTQSGTTEPAFDGEAAVTLGNNEFQISAATWQIGAWAGHEGSKITLVASDLKTMRPGSGAAFTACLVTVQKVDTVKRIITVKDADGGANMPTGTVAGDLIFFATELGLPPANDGSTAGPRQTMDGLHQLFGTISGNVLNINTKFSKWVASQVAVDGFPSLEVIARMTGMLFGKGLAEDSSAVFAPYPWVKLATEWTALKRGDLKTAHGFILGSNELEVQLLGLKVSIECAPYCRGGQGTQIPWSISRRIGSSEITDRAPGLDQDYIIKVPGTNTYEFQIFGNQAVYAIPGKCGNYTGVKY